MPFDYVFLLLTFDGNMAGNILFLLIHILHNIMCLKQLEEYTSGKKKTRGKSTTSFSSLFKIFQYYHILAFPCHKVTRRLRFYICSIYISLLHLLLSSASPFLIDRLFISISKKIQR